MKAAFTRAPIAYSILIYDYKINIKYTDETRTKKSETIGQKKYGRKSGGRQGGWREGG